MEGSGWPDFFLFPPQVEVTGSTPYILGPLATVAAVVAVYEEGKEKDILELRWVSPPSLTLRPRASGSWLSVLFPVGPLPALPGLLSVTDLGVPSFFLPSLSLLVVARENTTALGGAFASNPKLARDRMARKRYFANPEHLAAFEFQPGMVYGTFYFLPRTFLDLIWALAPVTV